MRRKTCTPLHGEAEVGVRILKQHLRELPDRALRLLLQLLHHSPLVVLQDPVEAHLHGEPDDPPGV